MSKEILLFHTTVLEVALIDVILSSRFKGRRLFNLVVQVLTDCKVTWSILNNLLPRLHYHTVEVSIRLKSDIVRTIIMYIQITFTTKKWKFSDKKFWYFFFFFFFHISAQNIDQRGGSNEYPQSKFLSRNKKDSAYPCKPQFYYIEVGI